MIFGVTMGLLVFILSFLGASLGPATAISLRLWGRRVQTISTVLIILVGGALIYAGTNPGVFNRLILPN